MPPAPENFAAPPPRAASRVPPIVCYVTDSTSLANNSAAHHPLTVALEGTGFSPSISRPAQGALAPEAHLLLDRIIAAAEAGATHIQLREKTWPGRALLDVALQTRARLAHLTSPPKLIINDRLDVALTASADGIQLGAASIPIADAVRFLRERRNNTKPFLLSASCHTLDEALAAQDAGATHIFFGPVFDSPSKRPFGPPQGLPRLTEVCNAMKLPVIAIGGITATNAHNCITAGASGVAAIREFQDLSNQSRAKNFVDSVNV